MTYVLMTEKAGQPEYQHLLDSYNSLKERLACATGYTDWKDGSEDDSDDGQSEEDEDPEGSGD